MTVKEKISLFPHSPGVYRYYDSEGNVIYVGKAKDLHNRVAQYFVNPSQLNRKTAILVSKIADAQFSVVSSEADAFLLENNLIKQYKPKYNILLKDSKTYPWICVSDEPFPRVFLTRQVEKSGKSRFFGPYSSVKHAYALLDFFFSNYPLRGKDCRYNITSEGIVRHKYRPCLKLHTGTCKGCCTGQISQKEYSTYVDDVVSILQGKARTLIAHYRNKMNEAARDLDFEQAAVFKDRMVSLENHYSKSLIVNNSIEDLDVFTIVFDADEAFGNFMRVRDGAVIQSLNLAFKLRIEESQSSVLAFFIAEIENKFGSLSKLVLVPFDPELEVPGVEFRVPMIGDKFSLLELSLRNAREARFNALKQSEHSDPDSYRAKVLEGLKTALGMKELPVHMECFDNSNIQGTNPVSACVVFRDGVPSKKDYRHFLVKTVVGANDYATMKEVVNRRYSRMLEENPEDLPQLIVIDGGAGQLNYAWQALCELGIQDRVFIIGLAERLEEVIRVGDPLPLFLDRNSPSLKLLQHIRDEAHRFGITHHRDRRSKAQIQSALREIRGVGEKMEQRLLLHFGSVARIAAASEDEIAKIAGRELAVKIKDALCNS